jgi:hypothetical protein
MRGRGEPTNESVTKEIPVVARAKRSPYTEKKKNQRINANNEDLCN